MFEMGFSSDARHNALIPNSTECDTWQKIRASHRVEDQNVTVRIEDTLGMLIVLASGFGVSLVIMTVEFLTKGIVLTK